MNRILVAAKHIIDCVMHEQTTTCRELFAGHVVGGFLSNEKGRKNASNDNVKLL